MPKDSTIHAELAALIGEKNVIADIEQQRNHLVEPRKRFHKTAQCVVTPPDVPALQNLVRWANDKKVPLIPQGGNTGLVGAQVPRNGDEVIVSLKQLNAILEFDGEAGHFSAQSGAVLQDLHDHAEENNKIFPLTLASQGSATLGGVLSSNAGGVQVLAYGNARELCLGVDVVLPNGEYLRGLNSLRKNNTGYDLKNLFIGAEGTLGFITAATMKLYPMPAAYETAWVDVTSPEQAFELFQIAKSVAGDSLTAFELMQRFGVEMLLRHQMIERDPSSSPSPWSVLIEISRAPGAAEGQLLNILEAAYEKKIIVDAVVAPSLEERENQWAARERMSEVQSREGASIKHDVSVPLSAVPQLISLGIAAVQAIMPEIRPCPFGHMGDGNLHFNFSQPVGMDKQTFMDMSPAIHDAIYEIVVKLGGSVSAEHGIGQLKTELLREVKDPVAFELMRQVKRTLDPNNILNPGKLFDTLE